MNIKVDTQYISVSCNRTPGCLDWSSNNKICYGACNAVVICDPQFNNICYNIKTLYKHTGRVNCVRWIEGSRTEFKEFVSASCDQTAIVWQINNNNDVTKTYVLKGHEGSINAVDGFLKEKLDVTYVATASVDSTIKIWRRNEVDEFTLLTDLNLKQSRCLSLKFIEIPNTGCMLLAAGLDNDKIYLFAEQSTNDSVNFIKVEELIGHEDWIRDLDFTVDSNGDLILASSSQDTYIRLWKIFQKANTLHHNDVLNEELVQEMKTFEIQSISTKEILNYFINLESVLAGHENWVYGLHWQKNKMQLLSSSMDKTMIIWKYDPEVGVWLESIRVGEVGGNGLGFYGGKFSPDGKSIIGHGYQGSFHLWVLDEQSNTCVPSVTIGGHFDEVIDISWEPNGKYLLSASHDQTTRLHGEWKRRPVAKFTTWHELSRPQVHGYDMSCVTSLSCYHFASAAEEKIIRLFQATHNFVENFRKLSTLDSDIEGDLILKTSSKGASVPSLGLSNKAVYDDQEILEEKHVKDVYPENYFVSLNLQEPPTEDNLMQNTLWPEVQKLYGHGYEVYCIASSIDNKILASACKANNADHASIILWNMSTGEQIQKLASHQLTVTQMEFSPNNQYLLSVSRDRRWTIFERTKDNLFSCIATTNKQNGIHARIIWCCCWTWDSEYFFTGSRDGKVAIWGKSTNNEANAESSMGVFCSVGLPISIKDSVTAVAVAPKMLSNGSYLLAIGTESGKIYLYECCMNKATSENSFKNLFIMDEQLAHHLTVKRLRFRPQTNNCLASCGSDHMVKIYSVL